MSTYYPPDKSCFVTASDLSDPDDERTCPYCGKDFDHDGRARAFFLRHTAACKDEFEGQATLEAFGASCPSGEATDAQVRRAIEQTETDA
jgi:hypothetical protein